MNTLLKISGDYAVQQVCKLIAIDEEKSSLPASESDAESADQDSETSDVPRHCDDHVICIPPVRHYTRDHPLLEEVREFVDVLLRCPPFINHLIVVKDHHNYEFCWCPMCSVLIDWTKQQCSTSFNSRIKKCKLKGRVRYNDLLNHLSSNSTCYFHQAAHFIMKKAHSGIKDLKCKYPALNFITPKIVIHAIQILANLIMIRILMINMTNTMCLHIKITKCQELIHCPQKWFDINLHHV